MAGSTGSIQEKDLPITHEKNTPSWNTVQAIIRRVSFNLWLWELLGLLTSVLSIGSILLFLSLYDRKPVPRWSYGLTVNGVVSILAGISKASIVLPTAEAISQLKWCWYWTRERRVLDFERFDNASRGPWGSLVLLCSPRLWSAVSIGAALTVAAIAIEPSLQQIPVYPLQTNTAGVASTSRSVYFNDVDTDGNGKPVTSSQTKGAVYAGLFSGGESLVSTLEPDCPTGNCTWPAFSYMGICSACVNISAKLYQNAGLYWMLPNNNGGANLSLSTNPSATGWLTSGQYNSLAFDQGFANQSMVDLCYMYSPPLSAGKIVNASAGAFECVLWPCVKTYEAAMVNGAYEETIVNSWPPLNTRPTSSPKVQPMCGCVWRSGCARYSDSGIRDNDCNTPIGGNLTIEPPHSVETFAIDLDVYNLLRNWLGGLFRLHYSSDYNLNADMVQAINDLGQAFYSSQLVSPNVTHAWQMKGPADTFDGLATSMTNYMRKTSGTDFSAKGTGTKMQVIVRARWKWAILPLALLVLTLGFLVLTIVLTLKRGVPIWESSSLAHVLHGLDDESCKALTARRFDQLETKAKGFSMKIKLDGKRFRLYGVQS